MFPTVPAQCLSKDCGQLIGVAHKQAIVKVVERKSGYAVMFKVSNITLDFVGSAIIQALKPFEARVKTRTYYNGKEFSRPAVIDKELGSTGYSSRPFASWE
jgi:IS30 family transposase